MNRENDLKNLKDLKDPVMFLSKVFPFNQFSQARQYKRDAQLAGNTVIMEYREQYEDTNPFGGQWCVIVNSKKIKEK